MKTPITTVTPRGRKALLKAVADMRKYDHVFLSPDGAAHFEHAFGVKLRTYVVKANPRDPKGLTLNDGATQAEGIAAEEMACQVCDHFEVAYDDKMGRGFQLRACCDALDAWINALPLTPRKYGAAK